ncbi:MAG: SDR family NAD(P)-dependent oxidoreductase [Thalassobaculales bacterium]
MSKPLSGQLFLVTGASRGLGAALAPLLAAAGARLVLLARTTGGLEEVDDLVQAAGGEATLVPLDITDGAGIDRLGQALYERWGRLDGLAACHGTLGTLAPAGHIEPRVWEEVLAVNLTASWRLIRALDPLLRAAPAGRAAFATCAVAAGEWPYWGAYAAAKAGLEALVRAYAGETRSAGLKVELFDPGPMRTALRAAAFPGEPPESQPAPGAAAARLAALLGA